MYEKIKQSKLLFWSIELLIIATLVLVLTKIGFIFQPVATFFTTLFAPVLIAGFLFYLLNPIVELLTKRLKIKRIFAIAIVFLLLIIALVLMFSSIIPNLVIQLSQLAESIPSFAKQVEEWVVEISDSDLFKNMSQQIDLMDQLEKMNLSYGSIIQQFLGGLSSSLGSIVGTIASATMTLVTAPFILFYMLKDGDKIVPNIEKVIPERRREQVKELLNQMNKTLSNYISGQAIECVFVATFTFLGYWILGVDYAFLFGMIAGVTNLIPYLGPYLGLLPAVFVTIFNDPIKALLCCVVVLVVQQLDGNIIYPNVIGKSLAIHPLTIIIVLLVAGNIAGLLGIFLGVPFYAICRTLVLFVVQVIREDKVKRNQGQFLG
ncbi:AI-2E family transporter [Enterococcus saccharolyticus]|uniref:AI-2E family transporter n=1 Tax=Candidatus Enterococcus willemsii TaxID=1857215 RepID=A0ABQ6Z1N7_9ENTE|nr:MULTISPECIES: AI-2E family transporter [Enterococcus]KAF1305406.1 AI-2E family transporter [Enterococcus sp. CU12B]MCD5001051.1 AI-2E family transporter [Enterococcus saccharolyticus]